MLLCLAKSNACIEMWDERLSSMSKTGYFSDGFAWCLKRVRKRRKLSSVIHPDLCEVPMHGYTNR